MDLTFDLARSSGFRYTCNRCARCCHHKRIMLNPYELLRLARNREISVEELIRDFTDEGGTLLRFDGADSACVFLGPEGCTVHPDRPLVCRLYPLGRFVPPQGGEAFSILKGHPESAGVFADSSQLGHEDTIGAYLDAQKVERHIDAAARYFELYKEIQRLASEGASIPEDDPESEGPGGEFWLHADVIAEDYCRRKGLPPPETAEEQMEAHIQAVLEWAARRATPASSSSHPAAD